MQHRENPLRKKIPEGGEYAARTILFQEKLMERALGVHPNPDKVLAWVEAHAAKFRKIIDADPAILVLWEENPDMAIQHIENQLRDRKK